MDGYIPIDGRDGTTQTYIKTSVGKDFRVLSLIYERTSYLILSESIFGVFLSFLSQREASQLWALLMYLSCRPNLVTTPLHRGFLNPPNYS